MRELGAQYQGSNRCRFIVWAPLLKELSISIKSAGNNKVIAMNMEKKGYFSVELQDVTPETKYFYLIDGHSYPDPASYSQPMGILGPSCVLDHASFPWKDELWKGIPLKDMIIYELHVGTFTAEGSFEAAIERLDDLIDLGITAIEVMPVAQFPGERNWGYDGVFPFAVQNSYGGPVGFKSFINACHQKGLAVILDVVYNHVGPEGNFLSQYMPCFTDKYRTPWGRAINYDDAYSYGVRNFFIQNALYWFKYYHLDALRLDAVHGIYDMGAKHFLRELSEEVQNLEQHLQKQLYLIAESDLNDRRMVLARENEGYGLDSQWSDDFHHSIHTMLTHEKSGYYEDFGQLEQIAKAFQKGFVYDGIFSEHRKKFHGSFSADLTPQQFVVCIQNHDQIGNRLDAARLSKLVSFESLKLAAGALLLSPYIPLLFMGEEYGEDAPFFYFMSFYDQNLIHAVREGRKREFSSFGWKTDPPDPYALETFAQCKLQWQKRFEGKHQKLLSFYKQLIHLRKSSAAFPLESKNSHVRQENNVLIICRGLATQQQIYVVMNFLHEESQCKIVTKAHKVLDSAEAIWEGPGSLLPSHIQEDETLKINPCSMAVYETIS